MIKMMSLACNSALGTLLSLYLSQGYREYRICPCIIASVYLSSGTYQSILVYINENECVKLNVSKKNIITRAHTLVQLEFDLDAHI